MIDGGRGLFMLPFLAAAVWYDWRQRRIPNWVTGLGLAAGIAAAGLNAVPVGMDGGGLAGTGGGGFEVAAAGGAVLGMGLVLLRAVVAVILTKGLYALRMVGAGDIKLVAMIVGGLGFRSGGAGILAGLCLGAAWSLVKLVRSGTLMDRLWFFAGYVKRCLETGRTAPYYRKGEDGEELVIPLGACIAVGSVLAVAAGWLRGLT